MGFKTAPQCFGGDRVPSAETKANIFAMMMLIKFHSFVHVRWRFFREQFIGAKNLFTSLFIPVSHSAKQTFPSASSMALFAFLELTFSHVSIDIASRCLSNVKRIKLKIFGARKKLETKTSNGRLC